jgi:hypothetical protein
MSNYTKNKEEKEEKNHQTMGKNKKYRIKNRYNFKKSFCFILDKILYWNII